MNEQTYELINLVVDGEATPNQQIELHQLLSASPEDQTTFDELHDLAEQLESHPAPLPPPESKSDILRAIQATRPSSSSNVATFRPRRKVFVAVYAAAAILVLGVALYPIISNQPSTPVDGRDAAGSMAPKANALNAIDVSQWQELVSTGNLEGGSHLIVLQSGDQIALEIIAPKGEVSLGWSRPELPVINASPAAKAIPGSITFPSAGGKSTIVFRNTAPSGSVDFVVLLDGKQLLTASAPLS